MIDQAERFSLQMIFASFDEKEANSRMKMTVLILWCIAVPVLSMNLLIAFLSNTYDNVRHSETENNCI
jgi:hypothetical protein